MKFEKIQMGIIIRINEYIEILGGGGNGQILVHIWEGVLYEHIYTKFHDFRTNRNRHTN